METGLDIRGHTGREKVRPLGGALYQVQVRGVELAGSDVSTKDCSESMCIRRGQITYISKLTLRKPEIIVDPQPLTTNRGNCSDSLYTPDLPKGMEALENLP
jgi:hypothetical protein